MLSCRRAKRYIALWVGDDLDEEFRTTLRQHVARCSSCRAYYRQMQTSFGRLQQRNVVEDFHRYESLWPEVKRKLPVRAVRNTPEFNGWWAALAVCITWMALITVWQNDARISSVSGGRDLSVQTVNEAEENVEFSSAPLTLQPEQPAIVEPAAFETRIENRYRSQNHFLLSLPTITRQPSDRFFPQTHARYDMAIEAYWEN